MRVNGRWLLCSDGVVRPVILVRVLAQDGHWWTDDFLLDTGADASTFSVDLQTRLGFASTQAAAVSGVGGAAASVVINTSLQLERDDGGTITIQQGQFLGLTGPSAFDMNVLGRDILDLFAVIVDHPGNVVCLLAPRHQYAVVVV
jgi:hypothetical protein